jgi:uncharacterized membrane protein HdeD (DUF308 family)
MNAEAPNENVIEVPSRDETHPPPERPSAEAPAEPTPFAPARIDAETIRHELQHLRKEWWWFLLLGVLLVILGIVAIVYPPLYSISSMIVLGFLLVIGGVVTVISSFWAGKWSALFLQLLIGILYLVVGFSLMDSPIESLLVVTLFVAAFFILAGLFRIVVALLLRFPHWGWVLLNGTVTLLLGVIIYRHWPVSSLWALGILIGVDMLFYGWTWIMLAMMLRKLPAAER